MRHYLLSLMLASAPLVGCGEADETEEDPEEEGLLDSYPPLMLSPGNVAAFATASAPNIFMAGIVILAIPGLQNDPACPKVTETATGTTYEGGCTTMEGTRIVGKAIVSENADGDGSIQYLGWGLGNNDECNGVPVEALLEYTGLMTFDKTAVGTGSFDLELELTGQGVDAESCATLSATAAYDYTGSFVGSEDAEGNIDLEQSTTWNGSGQVGNEIFGKVSTTTQNEVVDRSVCQTEAASGTTTLTSAPDTAVITYDGNIDCDMEGTVKWSLNGADQGELTGVQCSASPGRARGGLWGIGLLALACGLAQRGARRRRAR